MNATYSAALDELARLYVRRDEDPEYGFRMRLVQRMGLEPVVGELTSVTVRALYSVRRRSGDISAAIVRDEDLSTIRTVVGENDPFIDYVYGGHRVQAALLPHELLGAAIAQCMIRGLSEDEPTVRAMLDEALDALKAALNGELVNVYTIYGLTGVTLARDREIDTPWGVLRRAPDVDMERWPGHPGSQCTAIFVTTHRTRVAVSRDSEPSGHADVEDPQSALIQQKPARELLPLACVLGSEDDDLAAPALMWETHAVSFFPPTGYTYGLVTPPVARCPDVSHRVN